MSWILGYVSFAGAPAPPRLRDLPDRPAQEFQSGSLYIACNATSRTVAYSGDGNHGRITLGLGLHPTAEGVSLESSPNEPAAGHFADLHWTPDQVVLRTDPLGLRTVFLTQSDDGLLFSTRLDWIARASGRNTLDLEALGSRFLAFTQLSYESGIVGIDRLGPGGLARYSATGLQLEHRKWSPGERKDNAESQFTTALCQLLRPLADSGPQRVRIGLSGGVDSRLMLAMGPRTNLSAYTFGPATDPDVVAAKSLARKTEIGCSWFDETLPDPQTCVASLTEYAAVTSGFGFASDLIEKRHYTDICEPDVVVLFGLGGELLRRQFLNRFLLLGGSRALLRDEREPLHRLLLSGKPNLVKNDAFESMLRGATRRLNDAVHEMPDPGTIGTQNWADLFMVRYRVANPHMAHQTLLDHLGCGYSPFEQVAVLDPLFGIPVRNRRNSRLSKRLIKTHRQDLREEDLVMNDTTYPFEMSTGLAVAWTRFRTRNRVSSLQGGREQLLHHLEEFIRDVAASDELDDDPMYERPAIQRCVEQFYGGDTRTAGELERWLTFMLWRRSLARALS